MIDVNGNYLDLSTIKLANGEWYTGKDEIKSMISQCYQEMDKRFFRKNQPVIFLTPGIRSGNGDGNRGYKFPHVTNIKTKMGQFTIAWYESKTTENGKTRYTQTKKNCQVTQKSMTLYEEDIEKILFMSLFVKDVSINGKLTGKTFLQDLEADAVEFEAKEAQNAVVSYWLYTPEAGFYDDQEKLHTLARVYGIDPDGKSNKYIKQLIAIAARTAERRGDKDLDLKAFRSYCERLNHNFDTRDIEAMNLIAMSVKRKIIHFDYEQLRWNLIDVNFKPLKMLCKVPPQYGNNPKLYLKKHLIEAPDHLDLLRQGLDVEPEPSKYDRVKLSIPFPDIVTEDFILKELNHHDRRKLFNYITNDPEGAKMRTPAEINPILLEYFVVNKRTVPYEVKETK